MSSDGSEYIARANGVQVDVNVPQGWYLTSAPAALLVVPRQLFGVSNAPLPSPDDLQDQTVPPVSQLAGTAILIWAYTQAPGDPVPGSNDPVPDYADYVSPLELANAELIDVGGDEWDAPDANRYRLGFVLNETWVTVWAWIGNEASQEDRDAASSIVGSISAAAA